jgi:hypothetical protein
MTVDEIKSETFESIAHRNVILVVSGQDGFVVHQWSPTGVAPQSSYGTPEQAVARVAQLLKVSSPVTPQDWPEEALIARFPLQIVGGSDV